MTDDEIIIHLAKVTGLYHSEVLRNWNNVSSWYSVEVMSGLNFERKIWYPTAADRFEEWIIRKWRGDPDGKTTREILESIFPFFDEERLEASVTGTLHKALKKKLEKLGFTLRRGGTSTDWEGVWIRQGVRYIPPPK